MEYTYEVWEENLVRLHVTTSFEDVERAVHASPITGLVVKVFANTHPKEPPIKILRDSDDMEGWRVMLERRYSWKPKMAVTPIEKAINPRHYQSYVDDLQWIEVMSRLPGYRGDNTERFKGALELQVRKYLDRLGRKDESIQELKKARWYLTYLIAYMENGCKPIKVSEVEGLK